MLTLILQLNLFADDILKELEQLPILSNKNMKIMKYEKVSDEWYAIKAKTVSRRGTFTTVNLFTNKKMLFIGKGFDIVNKKEFIIQTASEAKNNIAFSFGSGKAEYFVFSDIECPYCFKYDNLLEGINKNKVKINILFYPLSFHLYAHSASQYIMSLKPTDRQEATANIMKLIKQNKLNEAILITSRFNSDFYSKVLNSLQGGENKYTQAIRKAFSNKIKNPNDNKAFKSLLAELISNSPKNEKYSALVDKQMEIAELDFKVAGTPSVHEAKTFKNIDPGSLFYKNDMISMTGVKNLEKEGLTINYGNGPKKIYYILGKDCLVCINSFNDKNYLEKLYTDYTVSFIVIPETNNVNHLSQIGHILSQPNNKRFELLKNLINPLKSIFDSKSNINSKKYVYDTKGLFVKKFPYIADLEGNDITEKVGI